MKQKINKANCIFSQLPKILEFTDKMATYGSTENLIWPVYIQKTLEFTKFTKDNFVGLKFMQYNKIVVSMYSMLLR